MALYIEIHCDVGSDGPPGYVPVRPYCLSHRNASPQTLAHNDRASLLSALKFLEQDAKAQGWKRKSKPGWICPNCAKMELPQ